MSAGSVFDTRARSVSESIKRMTGERDAELWVNTLYADADARKSRVGWKSMPGASMLAVACALTGLSVGLSGGILYSYFYAGQVEGAGGSRSNGKPSDELLMLNPWDGGLARELMQTYSPEFLDLISDVMDRVARTCGLLDAGPLCLDAGPFCLNKLAMAVATFWASNAAREMLASHIERRLRVGNGQGDKAMADGAAARFIALVRSQKSLNMIRPDTALKALSERQSPGKEKTRVQQELQAERDREAMQRELQRQEEEVKRLHLEEETKRLAAQLDLAVELATDQVLGSW